MKYKHTAETTLVLDDLENRLLQLIEASEKNEGFEGAKYEQQAFRACLTLVDQIRRTGHVFRGSDYVPDGLLQYTTIPSFKSPLKVEK